MSATFTPGPWSLALPDYDGAQAAYHDGVEPDQASVSGSGWSGLATVYVVVVVGGERDEAGEANARLISAAPDLLAACKREIAHTYCICHLLRRIATTDDADMVCDRCKTVAAIAKAVPS